MQYEFIQPSIQMLTGQRTPSKGKNMNFNIKLDEIPVGMSIAIPVDDVSDAMVRNKMSRYNRKSTDGSTFRMYRHDDLGKYEICHVPAGGFGHAND